MSTAILKLRQQVMQRNSVLHAIKIPWKALYIMAFCACALMLVLYVFLVNQLTQGSFLIKNYNKEVKSLLAENRNLQTSFGEANFWGGVQSRADELHFEKTTQVTYVKILEKAVATAK